MHMMKRKWYVGDWIWQYSKHMIIQLDWLFILHVRWWTTHLYWSLYDDFCMNIVLTRKYFSFFNLNSGNRLEKDIYYQFLRSSINLWLMKSSHDGQICWLHFCIYFSLANVLKKGQWNYGNYLLVISRKIQIEIKEIFKLNLFAIFK